MVSHSSLNGASGGLHGVAGDLGDEIAALRADLAALGDPWGEGELTATLGELDRSITRRLFERCADLCGGYDSSSGKVAKMSTTHRSAEAGAIKEI